MLKKCFGLLLCGLLTACASRVAETGPPIEMKTWCFGRFLIDIPVNVEVRAIFNKYIGKGIKIEKVSLSEFQQRIVKDVETLKQAKSRYRYDELIEVGENAYILKGSYINYGSRIYTVKTYKFDRGYFFSTTGDAYDDERIVKRIEKSVQFVRSIRYRSDDEIPKEPGICLQNGFIANAENTGIWETASLMFKLKDNPDVFILVKSLNNIGELEPSLSERIGSGQKLILSFKGLKTVRSGKHKVNGIPGEEILWQSRLKDNTGDVHLFIWEAQGEANNPDKPLLRLKLTTGGVSSDETVSSMETPEVVQLFDAILRTLRLRPVEEPKPQAKAPRFPRLATGDHCPKTGWWLCIQTNKMAHVYEGQNMPWVIYDKPATGLLNWLQGNERSFSHQGPGIFAWVGEQKSDLKDMLKDGDTEA